jgi:hypothetical protein
MNQSFSDMAAASIAAIRSCSVHSMPDTVSNASARCHSIRNSTASRLLVLLLFVKLQVVNMSKHIADLHCACATLVL